MLACRLRVGAPSWARRAASPCGASGPSGHGPDGGDASPAPTRTAAPEPREGKAATPRVATAGAAATAEVAAPTLAALVVPVAKAAPRPAASAETGAMGATATERVRAASERHVERAATVREPLVAQVGMEGKPSAPRAQAVLPEWRPRRRAPTERSALRSAARHLSTCGASRSIVRRVAVSWRPACESCAGT
jgi:hypothetical protein